MNTVVQMTSRSAVANDMTVSRQWASRPDDQRFLSLTELLAHSDKERRNSRARVVSSRSLEAIALPDHKGLQIIGRRDDGSQGQPADLTHWSFAQLCALADSAPAAWLRKLPAELAADNINVGLNVLRKAEDAGLLLTTQDDGSIQLRAATGPNYGRIWNSELVQGLVDRFGDGLTGNFRVPGEFGQRVEVTKANTTIYGSDRDVFVFLADEENRVDIHGRRNGEKGSLARGFYVWNSEVGSKSFGVAFFLFDYACSNRIIWGQREFKKISLRHTASAPDRWLGEIAPVLAEYSKASALPIEETIRNAQAAKVADDLDTFLASRKFTKSQITGIKAAHEREEDRPIETLWDVTTGVTAYAKTLAYQDARVQVERMGGDILDLVAA